MQLLRCREDSIDRHRDPLPVGFLKIEVLAALFREPVVLRPAVGFGGLPLRVDPSVVFEAMQGRIQRTLVDPEDFLGDGLDPSGYAVAVHGGQGHGFQDEQVYRTAPQCIRYYAFPTLLFRWPGHKYYL